MPRKHLWRISGKSKKSRETVNAVPSAHRTHDRVQSFDAESHIVYPPCPPPRQSPARSRLTCYRGFNAVAALTMAGDFLRCVWALC